MTFVLDDAARAVLQTLCAGCDAAARRQAEEIAAQAALSAADFDRIRALLPADAPFHTFALRARPRARRDRRPPPSQAYLERVARLRLQAQTRDYNNMISNVDPAQDYGNSALMRDFGKDLRETNRQLVAVINMLITVGGAFAFGFFGIHYAYPGLRLDVATRMVFGLVAATVVFFADLYFMLKSMDQDLQPGESKPFRLDTRTDQKPAAPDVLKKTTETIKSEPQQPKKKAKAKKTD